jgi:osmotically-inducible protein OsmY
MSSEADDRNTADRYLVAKIREALAHDSRVNELELEVTIAAGRQVFITGTVPTRERHEAVTDVVREMVPDYRVHNQTSVGNLAGPPEVEEIA